MDSQKTRSHSILGEIYQLGALGGFGFVLPHFDAIALGMDVFVAYANGQMRYNQASGRRGQAATCAAAQTKGGQAL